MFINIKISTIIICIRVYPYLQFSIKKMKGTARSTSNIYYAFRFKLIINQFYNLITAFNLNIELLKIIFLVIIFIYKKYNIKLIRRCQHLFMQNIIPEHSVKLFHIDILFFLIITHKVLYFAHILCTKSAIYIMV